MDSEEDKSRNTVKKTRQVANIYDIMQGETEKKDEDLCDAKQYDRRPDLPTSLISKAIAQTSHVAADGCPFRATYDADIFDRQYHEEKVLVGFYLEQISLSYSFDDEGS